MRLSQIEEEKSILKKTRDLLQSGKLKITEKLLALLEKVGVDLKGYENTVPIKEDNVIPFSKEKVYEKAA